MLRTRPAGPLSRALLGALVLAGLLVAAPSSGYVAPGALLVSASLQLREQGDDASTQPDLSSDGRYVVFSTTARNLFPADVEDPPGEYFDGGIFRRDLTSGDLELVALGGVRQELGGALVARGAGNPSVSGDGRWVVFSTGAALVPGDTNEQVDVYVRDMTRPTGDPQAYVLVSARDGSTGQARYERRDPSAPFRDPGVKTTVARASSARARRRRPR